MPAKRPTKRKLEPATDKVMRQGAPREPVKRVRRDDAPETASSALDAGIEDDLELDLPSTGSSKHTRSDDDEAALGTKARRAAAEQKAAAAAKKPRRRSRRVTEKGTPANSTRYTAPTVHYEDMPSPLWVPVLMFTMWILGMLSIVLNYVGLLPGGTSNWYLLLGLGFILAGIITATQYR